MIVSPEVSGAIAISDVGTNTTSKGYSRLGKLRPLKVSMGARTLWSDGGYTYEQMAAAALESGDDALFFADNALLYGSTVKLADPGFEDVTPSGNFSKWVTGSVPVPNSTCEVAVEPFAIPNIPPSQTLFHAKQRVLSGTHSLHLSLQCPSDTLTGWGRDGIAYVRDMFPGGYLFNNSNGPFIHPLLMDGLTLSVNVFLDSMAYAYTPEGQPSGEFSFRDNGWFYVRFILGTAPVPGPLHDLNLTITLVYSDHAVDPQLREIRGALNETNYKVIYLGIPPLGKWLNLNVNVTALASSLWNQTVAEYWRLNQFEIGAFSRSNGLVDAYVDDVSLEASQSRSPLEFMRAAIRDQVSINNFKVYSGYTIDQTGQASPYVYGTDYLNLTRQYNLTDPSVWKTLSAEVASHGGTIMMGPVSSSSFGDYIAANDAFGIGVIDASYWTGMIAAGQVMEDRASPVVFTATKTKLRPIDVNSSSSWSIMVFAENNSEHDILNAIDHGRAYLALNGFNGTFDVSAYGFPPAGTKPIYIPTEENASLTVFFTGLSPGLLRIFQGSTLALRTSHSGNMNSTMAFPLFQPMSRFFVGVSGVNDTLTVLSDPVTFVQTTLIPGTAMFIDNEDWSLRSSEWTTSQQQQRLRLVVDGPAGTDALLYMFSPSYRPHARSTSQVARSITIGNITIDPSSIYDQNSSLFILPLRSTGGPIEIVFNFDLPTSIYLYGIFSSLGGLYALVLLPFASTGLYMAARRRGRRHTRARLN